MSTPSRLYDAFKGFPETVLTGIIDCAEFLREKRLNISLPARTTNKVPQLDDAF